MTWIIGSPVGLALLLLIGLSNGMTANGAWLSNGMTASGASSFGTSLVALACKEVSLLSGPHSVPTWWHWKCYRQVVPYGHGLESSVLSGT